MSELGAKGITEGECWFRIFLAAIQSSDWSSWEAESEEEDGPPTDAAEIANAVIEQAARMADRGVALAKERGY